MRQCIGMSEQPSGIRTSTRLEYANGFLDLGMTDEASDELEAIEGEDRLSLPVMLMRSRLYLESKHWELLEAVAKHVADHAPEEPLAWVHWAYSARG